jgi:hypothetical protein
MIDMFRVPRRVFDNLSVRTRAYPDQNDNRAGGNGTGFRGPLLFFLDDLMPTVFGQPLLSNRPARSQIAW